MNIAFLAVDTLFVMFSAYLILFLYKILYFQKVQLRNKLVFIFVFSIINAAIHTISFHNSYTNAFRTVFQFITSILLMLIFIDKSIIKALIIFIAEVIALALGNLIVFLFARVLGFTFILDSLDKNIPLYIILNIIINLIAVLLIVIISPIKHLFTSVKNKKFTTITIIFTLLMLIVIIGLNFAMQDFNFLSITLSLIVLIIYSTNLLWISQYSYKSEIQRLERDHQKFYNETLESYLQNQKRFRHDWNNHVTVLYAYLRSKKSEEALRYLKELVEIYDEAGPDNLFDIKNIALFGLISSKYNLAKKKGINVDVKVFNTIDEIKNIRVSELSRIIGIFLDNAIEALENEDNKLMKIKLSADNGFINISIANTCSVIPDLDKIHEAGYSTKGEGRGEGLGIVKSLLGKNKYVLNSTVYNEDEKMFYQELAIKNVYGK